MAYEYVIVGGGAAGCVLANRLTENADTSVLLLEAGRADHPWDLFVQMPAAMVFAIGSRFYDWRYESQPEPHLHGRRIYQAKGKLLGGSTSINGMIFQRGNAMDFERWAADPGMESWDYAHCLPYFKRMEAAQNADAWRNDHGPLLLERGPVANPLFAAFFQAVQEAGYPLTTDTNGYRQEGFGAFDRTIRRGRRVNAARAYLHPIERRDNLDVRCGTFVNRVLFDGPRAVGVELTHRGRVERIRAEEIIMCGGAISSPQILQLSGVGAAAELERLGIRAVHDLPGVGENLQDHLEVYVQHASKQPVSVAPALKPSKRPEIGLRWLLSRTGPAATNHFEAGGFIRSNDEVTYPNVMFHFLPIAVSYDGKTPPGHSYQVNVGPTLSDARGSVKITSTDPRRHPAIRFNYLSTEQDRREWVETIRCARQIFSQAAFEQFDGGEISPGPAIQSDAEILDWVARTGEATPHAACSCRMGTGNQDVLDPETMRVHGLDGIRVVDASAMPYVTNGNIWAPVTMLSEKAADLIIGNTPLAPDPAAFYRHGDSVPSAT